MIGIEYLFVHSDRIFSKIKDGGNALLFLDYDGTLVGIKSRPQDAKPSQRTKSLINRLNSNPRIFPILVSGRPITQLMDFFKGTPVKELNMIGSHGAEVKLEGRKPEIVDSAKKMVGLVRDLKQKISRSIGETECFYIEDKRVSVAVHYRNCSSRDMPKLEEVKKIIGEATSGGGLDIIEGKKVIEVKASGIDKGMAVKVVEKKLRPRGRHINICIGDDLTDEHMFLKNTGGINIKVCPQPDGRSRAEYYLKTVGEVQKFLSIVNREVQ
ncbi:MAG: trehalose-phosphatase [Actinomycetota bacterium]